MISNLRSTLRGLALIGAATLSSAAFAGARSDDQRLEARLRAVAPVPAAATAATDWHVALSQFLTNNPTNAATRCVNASAENLAGKYAVSYTASGEPCRIYDLSFPTLATLFARNPVATLPVQAFVAKDYLNWINGDYKAVLDKIAGFPSSLSRDGDAVLAGWVKKVKFRPDRLANLLAGATVAETGLPASFSAADLELGDRFQFSAAEKKNLGQAIAQGARPGPHNLPLLTPADERAWAEVVERPEALLEQIKFNWDDAKKVYDVFVVGEFLPIRGPIALVDFSANYKLAVERTLRSFMRSAVMQIIGFIPGQAKAIVSTVTTNAFDFVESAYDYQLNQLEGTLRQVSDGSESIAFDNRLADRAMDITFGGKGDFVSAYLLNLVQKKPFDWNQFEELGRRSRYAAEKKREISLTNLNSRMVQQDGCQVKIIENYFGVCTKAGVSSLHSMISQSQVLFWNLGGPVLYKYESPAAITMQRSASYLLSVGASMLDLPILNYLTGVLATSLKAYATAGITDQAFLHNSFYLQKRAGTLGSENAVMLPWLYLQNINPFLAKTPALEQQIIDQNMRLLTK